MLWLTKLLLVLAQCYPNKTCILSYESWRILNAN